MIVLASSSKTRQKLLRNAGVVFEQQTPSLDENHLHWQCAEQSPKQMASTLARAKSLNVSLVRPTAIVIGADQTLEFAEKPVHKCNNIQAAKNQLQELSGQTHQLHSAVAVYRGGETIFECTDTAQLTMQELNQNAIDQYIDVVGPDILTSVGCYHIEGRGIQLFEKIDGDYFTILGLPLLPLLVFLRKIGELNP